MQFDFIVRMHPYRLFDKVCISRYLANWGHSAAFSCSCKRRNTQVRRYTVKVFDGELHRGWEKLLFLGLLPEETSCSWHFASEMAFCSTQFFKIFFRAGFLICHLRSCCQCLRCYCFFSSGNSCEELVDFCQSSPCLNGGVCMSSLKGYTCSCPLGFSGHNCSQRKCAPANWLRPLFG